MAQHYRRKKLLKALHDLYLDNFRDSQSWDYKRTERMLKGYELVRSKIECKEGVYDLLNMAEAQKQQLDLFAK